MKLFRAFSTSRLRFQDLSNDLNNLLNFNKKPLSQQINSQNLKLNKNFIKSVINVHCTRNNTLITLCDNLNQPLITISGGSIGFKSAQRGGYEAAYQAQIKLFELINQSEPNSKLYNSKFGSLDWNVRGFGQGRQATWSALMSQDGENFRNRINLVRDKTHLVRGGTRPKKQRRL